MDHLPGLLKKSDHIILGIQTHLSCIVVYTYQTTTVDVSLDRTLEDYIKDDLDILSSLKLRPHSEIHPVIHERIDCWVFIPEGFMFSKVINLPSSMVSAVGYQLVLSISSSSNFLVPLKIYDNVNKSNITSTRTMLNTKKYIDSAKRTELGLSVFETLKIATALNNPSVAIKSLGNENLQLRDQHRKALTESLIHTLTFKTYPDSLTLRTKILSSLLKTLNPEGISLSQFETLKDNSSAPLGDYIVASTSMYRTNDLNSKYDKLKKLIGSRSSGSLITFKNGAPVLMDLDNIIQFLVSMSPTKDAEDSVSLKLVDNLTNSVVNNANLAASINFKGDTLVFAREEAMKLLGEISRIPAKLKVLHTNETLQPVSSYVSTDKCQEMLELIGRSNGWTDFRRHCIEKEDLFKQFFTKLVAYSGPEMIVALLNAENSYIPELIDGLVVNDVSPASLIRALYYRTDGGSISVLRILGAVWSKMAKRYSVINGYKMLASKEQLNALMNDLERYYQSNNKRR